jgi:hypothetical protein
VVDPAGILPKFYKAYSRRFIGNIRSQVNTSPENAEVPHLKMLKVYADKTFSASPPDLEEPLESDGFRKEENDSMIYTSSIVPAGKPADPIPHLEERYYKKEWKILPKK